MKEYKPIACQLHDHIEHFATLKKVVVINYLDQLGLQQNIQTIIKNWINTGKGEYIILKENELKIRLDQIVSIDTINFLSFNSSCTKEQ